MDKLLSIPTLIQELLTAAHKGEQYLIEALSNSLSLPIFLTNPHYHLIASATPSNNEEIYSPIPLDQIITVNTIDHIENGAVDICEITLDDIVYTGWKTTVIQDDETLGFIFCLNIDSLNSIEENISFIQYASSLCVIPLLKKKEIIQEKKKYKEPYLFDLLYGNIKQREEIIERGKVWGWDFTIPQTAIVFSLSDFNHISVDRQIVETMSLIINDQLKTYNISPITMVRRNKVIILLTKFNEKQSELHSFIKDCCETVINELKTLYSDRQFVCGVGKTYPNPIDIYRSFQEAKVALEIGKRLNIYTPFFESLGIERILYKHDLQDLREFFETTLGVLIEYDETNNMQLIETLEAFSHHQFDITATSKALFLHRNTLRYRLKKIEEILDIKLDDWNNKLKITAAFKIKQLGKV